mgnify:CR=1 FL=1
MKAQDIIELLYKLQLREFEEHFKKVKEYGGWLVWVSALTKCPRKWLYMLRFPEVSQVEFKGSFILGRATHVGVQQLLQSYRQALGYDRVDIEVDVEKRIVLDDGRNILLTGRIDAIAYRADEKVIYEFKTARSDVGLPYEHHVLQLKIYMNIINVTKGVLLYLTPDRVTEYTINEAIGDEELKNLVKEFLEFKGPKYDWECNYCTYSVICPLKKVNVMRR